MGRKKLNRTRLTARIDPDTKQIIDRMSKCRNISMGEMIDRITEYTYRRSRIYQSQKGKEL
jgi:hypothetical protein